MSLYDLNRHLERQLALLEGGGRRPVPKNWVDFDPEKGHYWRTVNGQKIMFDQGGRMLNPPKWMGGEKGEKGGGSKDGLWKGPITKEQEKKLSDSQANVDQILGGDSKKHGIKVELDENGNPVLSNDEVQEELEKAGKKPSFALTKVTGKDVWDTFTSLVAMADTYSALLLMAGGSLSKVLGKATDNLLSALEDWQK